MRGDQFDVTFEDGRELRITVDGRDYMFYEQETGESAVELVTDRTFSAWYKAAAAACRRQGLFDGTPEEFYAAVAIVLPVVEREQPVDPTTPPEGGES